MDRLMRNRAVVSLLIAIASATVQAGVADQTRQSGPSSRWAGATSSAGVKGTSVLPLVPSMGSSQSAWRDDYALLPTERSLMTPGAKSSRQVARRHGSSGHASLVGSDFAAKARDLAETAPPWNNSPWAGSPWTASPH